MYNFFADKKLDAGRDTCARFNCVGVELFPRYAFTMWILSEQNNSKHVLVFISKDAEQFDRQF